MSAFSVKKHLPLIIILIIGTILRFYHNLDISIWHDEAFSALLIKYPWGEMMHRIGLDVHPPMYYIFLRLWHYLFGDSVLSLRGFSVFFGVAGIWAVWLFVKTAFKNQKAANWAALLTALNPFIADFSTEARMYTFGAFFAVMAAYFLVKALEEQKSYYEDQVLNMPNLPRDISLKRGYIWHYLGFAASTAVIMLTHYFLLFTAAALCFYGLIYHIFHYRFQYKKYILLLTAYCLIIASFLPWLKVFLFQYRQVGAGYWIPPMNIWSIPGTLWTILINLNHDETNPVTQKILILVVLFSLFFFWRMLKKTQSWSKWLAVLLTIAPFCGAILFAMLARLKGSHSSVYQERYFLYAGMFYIVALSVWLSEIKAKWLAACLLAAYSVFNLYAFYYHWQGLNVPQKPGMAAAAHYLGANVETGQKVFVGTSYEFFNYKYYELTYFPLPSGQHPLLFTGGRPDVSQISHVEGVAILSNADLAADFSSGVKSGDTTWLLWTYAFGSNKPNVPGNWTQIDQREFPDVRPYVGTSIYVTEYRVN